MASIRNEEVSRSQDRFLSTSSDFPVTDSAGCMNYCLSDRVNQVFCRAEASLSLGTSRGVCCSKGDQACQSKRGT